MTNAKKARDDRRKEMIATIHSQIREGQKTVSKPYETDLVDTLKHGLVPKFEVNDKNQMIQHLEFDSGFGKTTITHQEHAANLSRVLGVNREGAMNFFVNTLARSAKQDGNAPQINDALSMLDELKPRDAFETMLISQMVATHSAALRMMGRMDHTEYADPFKRYMNASTKLMRQFNEQMKTLVRYRTAGKQTVEVKHVHVGDGGQAIVGNVTTGGTDKT